MNDLSQSPASRSEEIDLLDYVNVLIKRRRMILRNTLFAGIAMALISLVLPKTYTATTTLLPPEEGEQSPLKSLLGNPAISFLDLAGVSGTTSEIFVEILKSRSVVEGVLKKNYKHNDKEQNLYEIWDEQSTEAAIRKLREKTRVTANEQGIIEVAVELRHPELAAQVANAYTAELDRINQEKSFSKAKNSRMYIETQLKNTEQNLKTASQALAEFQSQYKAVDLEEQTKIAIEKAGQIKGTIMAKEVELGLARQIMKPDNPIVERLQAELDELRKQFEHFQFGNAVPFEEQKDYFIPFSDVPEVGLKLAELIREVKVQETVWQLLNQQYYSAKIQEARDTPTVQVLDEAVPPEKRTQPKRTLLVLVAAFLTFMFSAFWAFVLEYRDRVKQGEGNAQKVHYLVTEVTHDYETIKKILNNLLTKMKKK
jgi:uncharacterized protein involved in exopolysaccharide biosynthesis